MDGFYLAALVDEIGPQITGRIVSRFAVTTNAVHLDLRFSDGSLLSVFTELPEPILIKTGPATGLSSGSFVRSPSVDWQSANSFSELIRKRLSGHEIIAVSSTPFDRSFELELAGYEPGGARISTTLRFSLAGRGFNVLLLDNERRIVARLKNNGPEAGTQVDPAASKRRVAPSETGNSQELFKAAGYFGPRFKTEFEARKEKSGEEEAIRSLAQDLANPARAVIYCRFELERTAGQIIDLRKDLILSSIKLVSAAELKSYHFPSLAEGAAHYCEAAIKAQRFKDRYLSLKRSLQRDVKRLEGALRAIEADRIRFADPEGLKKSGDLLLANLANARVSDSVATLIDYYDETAPEVEVAIDSTRSLQENAADYFARYQKARRALESIDERFVRASRRKAELDEAVQLLESEPTQERVDEVEQKFRRPASKAAAEATKSKSKTPRQGRWFFSSEGYEIVVGRNDRENDWITFKLGKSQDVWMHAADYPGSHVLLRNPTRQTVPMRSIMEAAQLAAFYSQAGKQAKAAVHYTERKFVTKPPKAKPGLVRLSSFKTILVEPSASLERIE